MHGTVEWLPGSPLGSTAESWPDMLLGDCPNIYVYACNNPSESLLAKRRGYATVVSHNVPPYARAGLYKELASMKDLLSELRLSAVEQGGQPRKQDSGVTAETAAFIPVPGQGSATAAATAAAAPGMGAGSETSSGSSTDVIPLIVAAAEKSGIFDDLPYTGSFADPADTSVEPGHHGGDQASRPPNTPSTPKGKLSSERAAALLQGPDAEAFAREFAGYAGHLRSYLSELEQRLFSEGLHEIGAPLHADQVLGYLDACFGSEETGVHGDALGVIAQGVVAMRDEQLQVQSRVRERGGSSVTFSGAATSGLLLRAEAVQRDRERSMSPSGPNNGGATLGQGQGPGQEEGPDWQSVWTQNRRMASDNGHGVDWKDLLTDEVRACCALTLASQSSCCLVVACVDLICVPFSCTIHNSQFTIHNSQFTVRCCRTSLAGSCCVRAGCGTTCTTSGSVFAAAGDPPRPKSSSAS